jgi:acyl-CoA thioester hydrolase
MENFQEGVLSSCPVVVEIPVAWGEMDAFGHVNNIIYFRYFETARIAYFIKLNLLDFMNETGIGPILASTQCKYRLPLAYPDTVSVGAKIVKLEADRLTMAYYVLSHKHQKMAAEGEGTIVSFDYRGNKKVPIPDIIRKRILELEKTENI